MEHFLQTVNRLPGNFTHLLGNGLLALLILGAAPQSFQGSTSLR